MIFALLAVGGLQTIAVGVVASDGGPLTAAIVGGVFLIINSLLTIVLTRIIDRRETKKPDPRNRRRADSDANRKSRSHRG